MPFDCFKLGFLLKVQRFTSIGFCCKQIKTVQLYINLKKAAIFKGILCILNKKWISSFFPLINKTAIIFNFLVLQFFQRKSFGSHAAQIKKHSPKFWCWFYVYVGPFQVASHWSQDWHMIQIFHELQMCTKIGDRKGT